MIRRLIQSMVGYRLAWKVFFSPHGGGEAAILEAIAQAGRQIRVMAYELTRASVAVALVNALDRKVDVQVILDDDTAKDPRSMLDYLQASGVPVWLDGKHPIMHNKVLVIDERTVITGSFNFTQSAELANCENLLVLQSPALAAKYLNHFSEHQGHSIPA